MREISKECAWSDLECSDCAYDGCGCKCHKKAKLMASWNEQVKRRMEKKDGR